MDQYIQIIFYHFILSDTELALKMKPDFFDADRLRICFKLAQEYVLKYHTAPSAVQLKELIHITDMTDQVGDDIVDIIYSSEEKVREFTQEWLYDNATAWAQWKNFLLSIRNMNSYIKLNQESVSVENVKEIMEHAKSLFNQNCIIEFSEDGGHGSDFWDAKNHKRVKMARYSTGYPFLDLCMDGGYFTGSLITFVGAPKIGKSLWLQNLCAESVKHGENNAYITLELAEEIVNTRIGANLFNIKSSEYHLVANDDEKMKEVMQGFKRSCIVPPGALIVKQFPTSAASVIDLEAFLLEKESELSVEGKPFHFKNVFVDYINIMRNYRNPNTENTYMKIKQIAEDLRAMAIKHNWTIITATQTNRAQFDTNDINGSNVSESTALIATVDLMFGIIASPEMRNNNKYVLKCMYDRVARKDGYKKDFTLSVDYLRITEDPNEPYRDSEVYVPSNGRINTTHYNSNYREPQQPQPQSQASISMGQIRPNTSFETSAPQKKQPTASGISVGIPLDAAPTIPPPNPLLRNAVNITGNGLFDKK
jgi:hypothetical protein